MTPDGLTNLGAAVRIANQYVPLQIRYGVNPITGKIDGWRVLVICILLNRTSREQVERVLPTFFDAFPFALYAEIATYSVNAHEQMEQIIQPLGFQHTKTRRIAFMSKEWLDHEDWRNSRRVHLFAGCGIYAVDAWRLFIEGDFSRPATDHVLETWRRQRALDLARSAV